MLTTSDPPLCRLVVDDHEPIRILTHALFTKSKVNRGLKYCKPDILATLAAFVDPHPMRRITRQPFIDDLMTEVMDCARGNSRSTESEAIQ